MDDEFTSLINEHTSLDWVDSEKNGVVLRELIVASGFKYDPETGQSEFDYYLNNLQRIDPLKTFVDDEFLFEDTIITLNCHMTKCEAIVHYIADHDNIKLIDGDLGLACSCCESLAFKLIKMGMDVHHVASYSKMTALHCAAAKGFVNVVKYLLNCNVDVNALDRESVSALHFVCEESGSPAVVDLIIQTEGVNLFFDQKPCRESPLGLAIYFGNFAAASTILQSKIANNLELDGIYDLFIILCNHKFGTLASMDFTLFLLLWEKLVQSFNSTTQSNLRDQSILSIYLNNIVFRSEHWFNALKVILTSTIASKLLEEFLALEKKGIFEVLVEKFDEAGVNKENRIELMKLILDLHVKPNLMDLAQTLLYFKCETEFDYLSFALRDDCLLNGEENQMEHVASVFCGLRDQLDFKRLENLDRPFYHFVTEYFTPVSLIGCLKTDEEINSRIPNVPSLKELSRNAARRFVSESTEILRPSHFTNFVNSLKIPVKHVNFIMLKTPLKEY